MFRNGGPCCIPMSAIAHIAVSMLRIDPLIPFCKQITLDLSAMLLDLIIETHAWASARPKHESTLAAHKIEQKIVSVIEAEKQQGMLPLYFPYLHFSVVGRQSPSASSLHPQSVLRRHRYDPLTFHSMSLYTITHREDPRTAERVRNSDEDSSGRAYWAWRLTLFSSYGAALNICQFPRPENAHRICRMPFTDGVLRTIRSFLCCILRTNAV